jgi:hypothetical protein
MIMPAWLLLLWAGLTAAAIAAPVAAAVGGARTASWSLAPAPASRTNGVIWTVLAGVLLYPAIYGFVFELLGRADLRTGALLGAAHGAIMFLVARRRTTTRSAVRTAAAHLVYAAALAFLYVTP